MKNAFTEGRNVGERVLIGVLIVTTTAVLLGIQSLFLTHIANALPQDSVWRTVTQFCFLAPPISFALLILLKMNYSRSPAQDWILIVGMLLELVLFVLNLIVAINANQIEGTMLGVIGLLLGGVAGVVGAGTVALTLSADPLRSIVKSRIIHDLEVAQKMQDKAAAHILEQMDSHSVLARAAADAERFVTEEYGRLFGRLPSAKTNVIDQPPPLQPTRVMNDAAPMIPQDGTESAYIILLDATGMLVIDVFVAAEIPQEYFRTTQMNNYEVAVYARDKDSAIVKAIGMVAADKARMAYSQKNPKQ